ncbi:MAG: DEAD/DEAH box helicase [Bacteroidota bacterium]
MGKKSPTFDKLGLIPPLVEALKANGLEKSYPIQKRAIPALLRGRDVLGIAQTGSGKTLAYALPLMQRLLTENWAMKNRHIPVLILVPTRELANQVLQVFVDLTQHLSQQVKCLAVFGGVSINPQMIQMQGVDVLIATPGRLLDLLQHKALKLKQLKMLVLDEADKMLNASFEEEMNQLLALMPAKRQNLLFSATLNQGLDRLSQVLLYKPEVIEIATEQQDHTLIEQRAFRVAPERKGPFLRYLIKSEDLHQVLVFTSSIDTAEKLVKKLLKNGIDALAIHGKKSNHARQEALKIFKAGELEVLVATDLLARGVDIDFLPFVINYELPRSPKDYIHRIGRTGRAERSGQAYTLVTPEEQAHFKVIQKKMGRWLTLEGTEELDLRGF